MHIFNETVERKSKIKKFYEYRTLDCNNKCLWEKLHSIFVYSRYTEYLESIILPTKRSSISNYWDKWFLICHAALILCFLCWIREQQFNFSRKIIMRVSFIFCYAIAEMCRSIKVFLSLIFFFCITNEWEIRLFSD